MNLRIGEWLFISAQLIYMKRFQTTLRFICFIIIIIVPSLHSFAQAKVKEINHQSQSWFSINSTTRLTNKFGIIADLHMRRNNFAADPSFYFARIGANYWIKENITAVLGYGQMWVAPTTANWHHFVQEHRVYQQIQMSTKIGKISLLNRLRNEQRWQEKIANDKFTHNYKFTDRIRYLLSMTIPVFKNPKYPSLVLADELCFHFGKEVIYNTFDQNRYFIGIKQPISKSLSFDTGYMMVFQQKASGYQYDKNQTYRLFFYYTPDLRKKK
ncbi:MAG: hypothetical protein JWP81_4345 [Ferruginibacter sp.]|nr:hypothetical protein [Ferruginibacter sp.]